MSAAGSRPIPSATEWFPSASISGLQSAQASGLDSQADASASSSHPLHSAALPTLPPRKRTALEALSRASPIHALSLRSAYELHESNRGSLAGKTDHQSDGYEAGTSSRSAGSSSEEKDESSQSSQSRSIGTIPWLIPPSEDGHWTMWAPHDTYGRESSDFHSIRLDSDASHGDATPATTKGSAFETEYLFYSAAAVAPTSVLLAPPAPGTSDAAKSSSQSEMPEEAKPEAAGSDSLTHVIGGMFGADSAILLGGEPASQARDAKPVPHTSPAESVPDEVRASHHVSLCADFAVLPGTGSVTAIR